MPNIASVFRAEIARVARKELKGQTDSLKKAIASQRQEISLLRKRVTELEAAQKSATRAARQKSTPTYSPESNEPDNDRLRFRPAGMASNRKRLDLSASEFGRLIGVTAQTIYAWESGKSRPGRSDLAAIAALRGIGKRQVTERLSALK